MNLTINEIVSATNGKLLCGNLNTYINSISTNSKEISENTLFVPIKGQKTDAHDFIESAFDNGAIATLTERNECNQKDKTYILVNDTKLALQRLAEYYRMKFNIPVIGVTGSVGKTTTKEIIASALSAKGRVMKTSGNQNSQIGVPLTVFKLCPEDDFAIIELGMSEFGEMERISKVAKVNHAVITNIGISHIENLKTQENICKEKLHIIDHFDSESVLYLNGDDPILSKLKGKINAKTVFFGTSSFCDYKAENIEIIDNNTTKFDLITPNQETKMQIPTIGNHNVLNSLAAVAICIDLGFNIDEIQNGLNTFKQPKMRQQITNTGFITVIDDSYNASPDSIKSGINILKSVSNNNRTIAVLADMLELGEYSFNAHFSLGEYLAENKVDIVLTVGNEAKAICQGALSQSKNITAKSFENNEQVMSYLNKIITKGDVILVKGSRGMHTDEIVNQLLS